MTRAAMGGGGGGLALLGDPLAGMVMPPGDPGVLRAQAAAFGRVCAALNNSANNQARAVHAVTGATWQGVGAQAAHGAVDKLVAAYQKGSTYASHSASVLNDGAGKWDAAHTKYGNARTMADQALQEEFQVALAAALAPVPAGHAVVPTGPPWASPLRAQAQHLASEAITDFTNAANNLAGQLAGLGGNIGGSPAFIPQPSTPWYDKALHGVEDGVDWVGQQFANAWHVVDNVKTAVDFAGLVGSAALTAASLLGEGTGVALDATGVLAVVGVPLNVLSAAGIATGAGGAVVFGDKLGNDLNNGISESRSRGAIESDPGFGASPKAGGGTPVGSSGVEGEPFDPEIANQVPDWGDNGVKTAGIVDLGDGETLQVTSGRSDLNAVLKDVPKGGLKGTGLNAWLRTHVEAQTAIYMRLNGLKNATLYINRAFCGEGSMQGCINYFQRYLAEGQTVTVYGPTGGTVIEGTGPAIPGIDG